MHTSSHKVRPGNAVPTRTVQEYILKGLPSSQLSGNLNCEKAVVQEHDITLLEQLAQGCQ